MPGRRCSDISTDLSTLQGSVFDTIHLDTDHIPEHRTDDARLSATTVVSREEHANDTAPFLSETDDPSSKDGDDTSRSTSLAVSEKVCNWLPTTLRIPFLVLLFISSLVLGVVVLTLFNPQSWSRTRERQRVGNIVLWLALFAHSSCDDLWSSHRGPSERRPQDRSFCTPLKIGRRLRFHNTLLSCTILVERSI